MESGELGGSLRADPLTDGNEDERKGLRFFRDPTRLLGRGWLRRVRLGFWSEARNA